MSSFFVCFVFKIGRRYLCENPYFLYIDIFCPVQMRILEKQRLLFIQSHIVGSSKLENTNSAYSLSASCFNEPVPQ